MREPIDEWLMVCDLMLTLGKLPLRQAEFVENLYKHLDPHEPFLEQQSVKQLKWLKFIHSKIMRYQWEW